MILLACCWRAIFHFLKIKFVLIVNFIPIKIYDFFKVSVISSFGHDTISWDKSFWKLPQCPGRNPFWQWNITLFRGRKQSCKIISPL